MRCSSLDGPSNWGNPVATAVRKRGKSAARVQAADTPFTPSADDLLSLIGDGVVATDAHGRIILFNRAAELMFGYDREEVAYAPVETLMPARFRSEHRQQVADFIAGEWASSRLMGARREVVGRRRSGAEFWAEASLSRRLVNGRSLAIVVLRDISERKHLEEQRRLLSSEMAHRLKNSIAVINSIISLMAGSCSSVPSFAEALQGRLGAIANSNELLMQGEGTSANLRQLLHAELGPFLLAGVRNVRSDGPNLVISHRLAVALSLVFHELVTNSVKYGAFSRSGGLIDVQWSVHGPVGKQRLDLRWREEGGPEVRAPSRRGFGTQLIERMLGCAFDGNVVFEYRGTGLICRLDVALD